jgi:hypothetical protein
VCKDMNGAPPPGRRFTQQTGQTRTRSFDFLTKKVLVPVPPKCVATSKHSRDCLPDVRCS